MARIRNSDPAPEEEQSRASNLTWRDFYDPNEIPPDHWREGQEAAVNYRMLRARRRYREHLDRVRRA